MTTDDESIRVRLDRIAAGVVAVAEGQQVIATVAGMEARVMAKLGETCERLERVEKAMHGEGDGRSGLANRVSKLEDNTAARASVIVAVIAAIAAIGGAIIATRAAAPPPPRHPTVQPAEP